MTYDKNSTLGDVHSYGVNIREREIYLHGYYDKGGEVEEEPGVEYRMATTFIKNIHLLQHENGKDIFVYMHTVGGGWNDGMAIFNVVEHCPCVVSIVAHAHARSMSSIILQAADYRLMMPDADFMIHYGELYLGGYTLSSISAADYEKKLCHRMLDIYTERCIEGRFFQSRYKSLTKDKVRNYIKNKMQQKGDWWLSAEEAVYYGFADGVLGQDGYETMAKPRDNA